MLKQCYYILVYLFIIKIYGFCHQCSVKRQLSISKRITKHMLMKTVRFAQKPFHSIAFGCFAKALFNNKTHEAAERSFVHKLEPQIDVLFAVKVGIAFKQAFKILSAPQDFFSGQTVVARGRRVVTSAPSHR